MKNFASADFWQAFSKLPKGIQRAARKNYQLLRVNPKHPSLRFKRIGQFWSVRVSRGYRALGVEVEGGILWGWIGTHSEYERIVG